MDVLEPPKDLLTGANAVKLNPNRLSPEDMHPPPFHKNVHPTYLKMIKTAITEIGDQKHGASKAAILKYIASHYDLGENVSKINTHLCAVLKKATEDKDLNQVKGRGASGSFALPHQTVTARAKSESPKVEAKVEAKPEKEKREEPKKDKKAEPVKEEEQPSPPATRRRRSASDEAEKPAEEHAEHHHPTYAAMIKSAINDISGPTHKGASKTAILKYIASHYDLGENLPKINTHLCQVLKKELEDGEICHAKGRGVSGSFLLPSERGARKVNVAKAKPAKQIVREIKKKQSVKEVTKKAPPRRRAANATARKEKEAKITKKSSKIARKTPRAKKTAAKAK